MKMTQKLLARAFSPATLDLFAYIAERCQDNPVPWSFFGLIVLLYLLMSVVFLTVVLVAARMSAPHFPRDDNSRSRDYNGADPRSGDLSDGRST